MADENVNLLIKLKQELFFYFLDVSNERGYATPESCVSYINSTIPQWKLEAEAFNLWRDSVYTILNKIEDDAQGEGKVPSFDYIISQLPELVWPVV